MNEPLDRVRLGLARLHLDAYWPRAEIPAVALACLEAGLGAEEAWDVWAFEVTPAVGLGWLDLFLGLYDWEDPIDDFDPEWVREQVATHARPARCRSLLRLFEPLYRPFQYREWRAVARAHHRLVSVPLGVRAARVRDLVALGRCYWLGATITGAPARLAYLRDLYVRDFLPIQRPLADDPAACHARVIAGLSMAEPSSAVPSARDSVEGSNEEVREFDRAVVRYES